MTKKDRVKETRMINCGTRATIIAYRNSMDMDVRFDNGSVKRHVRYSDFIHGSILNPAIRSKHLSKWIRRSKRMHNGLQAIITAYRNINDVDVVFENGVKRQHVRCSSFERGSISCPGVKTKYFRKSASAISSELSYDTFKKASFSYACPLLYAKAM